MQHIKYLLKFGKADHLKFLAKGNLYFSNAEKFWGIEDEQKIKGQGDQLEAGAVLFAQKISAYRHEDNALIAQGNNCRGLMRFESVKNTPVFCLFAVFEKDCVYDNEGNVQIKLSPQTKNVIRKHFPNADSVAIIDNPEMFLRDIEQSIGYQVKHELVGYYHLDAGLDADNGKKAMDMAYINYIMQDTPPSMEGNGERYVLYEKYAFRILFCKDIYFADQQEYRILLPTETIIEPKSYSIQITNAITIMPIDDFFRNA